MHLDGSQDPSRLPVPRAEGYRSPSGTTSHSPRHHWVSRASRSSPLGRRARGAGIKHYAFRQQELEGEAARVFAADETRRTLHLGLGLDTRWRRYSLVTEVGNYFSSFGEARPSPIDPARLDRGARQHDLFLSFGLRVPIF